MWGLGPSITRPSISCGFMSSCRPSTPCLPPSGTCSWWPKRQEEPVRPTLTATPGRMGDSFTEHQSRTAPAFHSVRAHTAQRTNPPSWQRSTRSALGIGGSINISNVRYLRTYASGLCFSTHKGSALREVFFSSLPSTSFPLTRK